MSEFHQGEVWWAQLPLPAGRRPTLILTRSDVIAKLTNVTVAPLTRTIRNIKSEVVVSSAHGLPSSSAISLDNIVTIPQSVLIRRITKLSKNTMDDVFAAIRFAFAMPS